MSNLFIDKLGKEFNLKTDIEIKQSNIKKFNIKFLLIVIIILIGVYYIYNHSNIVENFLFSDRIGSDFNRPVLNPGISVDKQWNGSNYLGNNLINGNMGVVAPDGEQVGVVYDNIYNKYQFKGPEYVYNDKTYINAVEYNNGYYNF